MAATIDGTSAPDGHRTTAGVDAAELDFQVHAQHLVSSLLADPWGQVSPSVYETARLVAVAPWLPGVDRRVSFLLRTQEPDGGWGSCPDSGYRLVPTLSAVDALLALSRRAGRTEWTGDPGVLARAAARGLGVAHGWLSRCAALPDTPAVELIVPALVATINGRLDQLSRAPVTGLDDWVSARLPVPAGVDRDLAGRVRTLVEGGAVPPKLLHSLEVVGVPPAVRPTPIGPDAAAPATVGASPASTAAWLTSVRDRDPAALRYLLELGTRHGGAVPSVIPITMFERSWVLSTLHYCGLAVDSGPIPAQLAAALGPEGTPGGAGLPTDSDTTSVVVLALAQRAAPSSVEPLWRYQAGDHFVVWPGERTASVTANAHVLEAFGHEAVTGTAADPPRWVRTVDAVAGWLTGQQDTAGWWTDKWHASPYYATACAALALHRYAGPGFAPAVRRAVDWLVSTQRDDGSWGRWGGTVEETAYAVQVLLSAGAGHARAAGLRGAQYLCERYDDQLDPPLWHDKDLYCPTAVVRAATLGAMHLASTVAPAPRRARPARRVLGTTQSRA